MKSQATAPMPGVAALLGLLLLTGLTADSVDKVVKKETTGEWAERRNLQSEDKAVQKETTGEWAERRNLQSEWTVCYNDWGYQIECDCDVEELTQLMHHFGYNCWEDGVIPGVWYPDYDNYGQQDERQAGAEFFCGCLSTYLEEFGEFPTCPIPVMNESMREIIREGLSAEAAWNANDCAYWDFNRKKPRLQNVIVNLGGAGEISITNDLYDGDMHIYFNYPELEALSNGQIPQDCMRYGMEYRVHTMWRSENDYEFGWNCGYSYTGMIYEACGEDMWWMYGGNNNNQNQNQNGYNGYDNMAEQNREWCKQAIEGNSWENQNGGNNQGQGAEEIGDLGLRWGYLYPGADGVTVDRYSQDTALARAFAYDLYNEFDIDQYSLVFSCAACEGCDYNNNNGNNNNNNNNYNNGNNQGNEYETPAFCVGINAIAREEYVEVQPSPYPSQVPAGGGNGQATYMSCFDGSGNDFGPAYPTEEDCETAATVNEAAGYMWRAGENKYAQDDGGTFAVLQNVLLGLACAALCCAGLYYWRRKSGPKYPANPHMGAGVSYGSNGGVPHNGGAPHNGYKGNGVSMRGDHDEPIRHSQDHSMSNHQRASERQNMYRSTGGDTNHSAWSSPKKSWVESSPNRHGTGSIPKREYSNASRHYADPYASRANDHVRVPSKSFQNQGYDPYPKQQPSQHQHYQNNAYNQPPPAVSHAARGAHPHRVESVA